MILLIVIFILNQIDPSKSFVEHIYKKASPDLINAIIENGLVTKFDELGRLAKAFFYIGVAVEIAVEFVAVLKFIPFLIKTSWEKRKDTPAMQKQILENIKYKLDNTMKLNRIENKFYKKYIRK